jgi:hypothetical protein
LKKNLHDNEKSPTSKNCLHKKLLSLDEDTNAKFIIQQEGQCKMEKLASQHATRHGLQKECEMANMCAVNYLLKRGRMNLSSADDVGNLVVAGERKRWRSAFLVQPPAQGLFGLAADPIAKSYG